MRSRCGDSFVRGSAKPRSHANSRSGAPSCAAFSKKGPDMGDSSIQFHKIWIEQCEATEGIRERFGLEDALDYLIGEKLFHFVQAAEQHPEFAAELPAFVAEIQRLFTAGQIRDYLDDLEQRKYLAPREPDPVL